MKAYTVAVLLDGSCVRYIYHICRCCLCATLNAEEVEKAFWSQEFLSYVFHPQMIKRNALQFLLEYF